MAELTKRKEALMKQLNQMANNYKKNLNDEIKRLQKQLQSSHKVWLFY